MSVGSQKRLKHVAKVDQVGHRCGGASKALTEHTLMQETLQARNFCENRNWVG